MHFDTEQFSGGKLFWEILSVYWAHFSPAIKIMLGGYVVILLFVLIKGNKKERIFFVASLLILVVTCLNPWMARYLIDHWGFFTRYFRFFWLIPITIGYTYMGMKIYERMNDKGRIVCYTLCIILFVMSVIEVVKMTSFSDIYTGAKTNTGMIMVSNAYKVEDDIIGVSSIIEDDYGAENESKIALYNRDVFVELRAYNPLIIPVLRYGETRQYDYNKVREDENWKALMQIYFSGQTDGVIQEEMTSDLLGETMSHIDCNYVILSNTNTYYNVWCETFYKIGEAGRYTVLKVK